MKTNRAWALQSFIACFFFNSVLACLIFFIADKIVGGISEWISPFLNPGAANIPDDMRSALGGIAIFLSELRSYLVPALAALAGAATLLLWFCVFLIGRRQIGRAAKEAPRPTPV